ncbi:hypothetical protein [Bradyrhizobium sp. CCGE-LA001]|nr:hypothetical protein [Bradyrhizobium sp. CCGE-LA001]
MRETWYVLEDGRVVDPNEVAPDDHARWRRVARRTARPAFQ